MSTRTTRQRTTARPPDTVSKPRGTFHPRVQAVGPEHFGIVTIDCAKARSQWMRADFFGNVLIPPTTVAHNRNALHDAIALLNQTIKTKGILDCLVAVERTGRYHRTVQHAFKNAGFDTRLVHPFATAQFRQPAAPGHKTDDTDLAARPRATVQGFALAEQDLDELWQTLQLLVRQRRHLVFKTSKLCCQAREHLDAVFPGFANCFADIFARDCAWHLVAHFATPAELHAAGLSGLTRGLREAAIGSQERTLHKVLDWAAQAAAPAVAADAHRRIALALPDDYTQKSREIQTLERELAGRLARTPYLLLLAIPGSNVVSAAEFAGAMGPISLYAHAKTITGRAGLCPSR
jgi:transposase